MRCIAGDGDDSVDGGGGNDTIVFDATELTAADTIKGGAGTDTLKINSGAANIDLGALPNLAGVETINLNFNAAHQITIADSYYSSADFSGTTVTVTTNSATGISVDGSAVLAGHKVSITGNGGNDTLVGGADNDSFSGGGGNDHITGGDGDDRFTYNAANLDVNDTLIGGAGSGDYIYITAGTFVMNIDTLTNVSGIETIYVNNAAAHEVTLGDAYFATGITGSTVNITNNGATGVRFDATSVANAANSVNLTGKTGDDTLLGGAGDDTIESSSGTDSIDAGSGNDLIEFNGASQYDSADIVYGGTGDDVVTLIGGSGNFVFNATTTNTLLGIESFALNRNGSHAITLDDAYYSSTGFNGSSVTVSSTSTTAVNFDASAVANATHSVSLTSAGANDTLKGGAGNDTISGGSGNNILDGGAGDDLFQESGTNINAADTISGGTGTDTLRTTGGTLNFNSGTFTNFTGIERFELNNNANHSLTFNDDLFASAGFVGNTATVTMTATNNININGSAIANAANSLNLTGGTGNNNFTGGAGNDTFDGGAGTDQMTGGLGVDVLTGGTGNDSFIYTADNHSGIGAGNRDIIQDFTSGDKITLTAFAGTFAFRAGGAGEADYAGAQQVAWQQVGADVVVYIDSNGDNTTDFEIELAGVAALVAGDFNL